MKQILLALCLAVTTGCAYSNSYGRCIGVFDEPDPKLEYHYSVRNIVWTALSPWTIVSPVVWVLACAKCPTGYKFVKPAQSKYHLQLSPEFNEQLAAAYPLGS
jgi:hypothetical protein